MWYNKSMKKQQTTNEVIWLKGKKEINLTIEYKGRY